MAARKDQKNPKTAKKAEQSELLWAVGELWHLVEDNKPDEIRKSTGYSQSVRNILASVCFGVKGESLEKSRLQRDLLGASIDLHKKVSANKAANTLKIDEMAMEREAKIQAAEIDEMILEIEVAKLKGWKP